MPDNTTQTDNPLDLWRQFISDSERQWNSFFKDVLGSDTASSAMNTMMEASLTVQRMVADNLERYYTTFNIPTHNDLIALGERMRAIEDTLARIEAALLVVAPEEMKRTRTRPKPARTKRPPAAAQANGAAAKSIAGQGLGLSNARQQQPGNRKSDRSGRSLSFW